MPTPFCFLPREVQRQAIDTIIFLGKRSRMKGFNLFLDAAQQSAETWHRLGIGRIVIIAPPNPTSDRSSDGTDKLELLKRQFLVEEYANLDRHGVKQQLETNARRSIVTLPYSADNFPLAASRGDRRGFVADHF